MTQTRTMVFSSTVEPLVNEIERAEMLARERAWVSQLEAGALDLNLLPVPLYDYQVRGALFLACRGRSILGDDMGLGKTLQALAVMLARSADGPALVIAPTSVCGNWLAEILRFAPSLNATLYGEGDRAATEGEATGFYQRAEDLLARDLPVIPLRSGINTYGHSARVRNVHLNLFMRTDLLQIEPAGGPR